MSIDRRLPWDKVRWMRVEQFMLGGEVLSFYWVNGWDIGPLVARVRSAMKLPHARKGTRRYYRIPPGYSQHRQSPPTTAPTPILRARIAYICMKLHYSATLQKCCKRVAESGYLT